MNGHEVVLDEATHYTEAEVLERVPHLCGVEAIEAVNPMDCEIARMLSIKAQQATK